MGREAPKLNRTADGQLACAFGEPWMGLHPLCDAYRSPTAAAKPKRGAMPIHGYSQNLIFQCRAAKLPPPTPEFKFHPTRRWRLDLAWPERRLYAEVDGGTWVGGRHNRGKGYEADCTKLNAACLAGWRGFRFTTAQVKSGAALGLLEQALGGIPEWDAESITVAKVMAGGTRGATP